jgi:hypothetical protein
MNCVQPRFLAVVASAKVSVSPVFSLQFPKSRRRQPINTRKTAGRPKGNNRSNTCHRPSPNRVASVQRDDPEIGGIANTKKHRGSDRPSPLYKFQISPPHLDCTRSRNSDPKATIISLAFRTRMCGPAEQVHDRPCAGSKTPCVSKPSRANHDHYDELSQ